MQWVCQFLQCKQVLRFYIHLICVATALTPDPVQNLTAVVDTHKASVTLKWDPPANAAHAGYVTKYELHFQNQYQHNAWKPYFQKEGADGDSPRADKQLPAVGSGNSWQKSLK